MRSRSEIEDFKGRKHEFSNNSVGSIFERVDKLEEAIRDKYFDNDIEYVEGVKMVQRIKGHLRKLDKDLDRLETIRYRGMPDDEED